MKIVTLVLFAALVSVNTYAASGTCTQLKQELLAMKKAQQSVMASLVNNHETFASTMEEYSSTIKEKPQSQKQISQQMNKSAEAFRRRGIQGKQMATQLDTATADLISRVAECL